MTTTASTKIAESFPASDPPSWTSGIEKDDQEKG
jgi:hypothetical protein